jgi:hypothetical protein
LDLFEKKYQTKTKFIQFLNLIENIFLKNENKFLKERKDFINLMKTSIEETEEYKKFSDQNNLLKEYDLKKNDEIKKMKNLYNKENENKFFISIDLSKANFYSLKIFDKV